VVEANKGNTPILMNVTRALRALRLHPWLGLVAGLGFFAIALGLRFALDEVLRELPFITLFPAILLAALVGGRWVGLLVAGLSGLSAWYWFMPPTAGVYAAWPKGVTVLALFVVSSGIMLYVIDVLHRTIDELALENSRSAVMFQELQHRVANNMQFVSSLLRLQRKSIGSDPQAGARALEAAQLRLDAMAHIHRQLYDPSMVDLPLGQYLQKLCTGVLEASGAKNIVCVVEVPPVHLDLRRMVTLSLLVTEVITNSIKHAFDPEQNGTISIRLDHDAERYVLTVQDDGRGLPEQFDAATSTSLGVRIMQNLAQQLRGELTFQGGKGAAARVVFPAI
jgi:two-component sensor histidine kinase